MKTLIKNGTIVTAADKYAADLLIEDETITLIGANLSMEVDKTIDATGCYVMPGGIDVHTHMDLPFGGTVSSDDFETGTIAAAWGGTTSIVDFAVQSRGTNMRDALDAWHARAQGKVAIDYGLHMIMTELPDPFLTDMDALVREGVTSFKLFMAYPGVFMVDDATIFKAMKRAGDNGAFICMHAENGGVIDVLVKEALAAGKTAPKYHALTRPSRAEAEASGRAIALAEMAGVPLYIVHMSSAEAMYRVREARDRGLPIYAETCPQYLFLSDELYDEPNFGGAKYVMSPPLRPKWHQPELWKGLMNDDLQLVSTDHCPFCMKEGFQGLPMQKELGKDDFSKIPNGAPGVETRFPLMYDGGVVSGKLSVHRFVEIVSTVPAKLFGLYPRKGTIAVGSDGDIVIFDPEAELKLGAKHLHMRCDYNPYEGRVVKGVPKTVLVRGKPVIENREYVGKAGSGTFLKRGTYSLP